MQIAQLKNVVIVGAGAIGRQIGSACLRGGFNVTLVDVDPQSLQAAESACRTALQQIAVSSRPDDHSSRKPVLCATNDASEAGRRADLLIESTPERLELKRDVFRQFAEICPDRTIFTTNTSVFMPSMLAPATGRPDRFAAFHFVMGGELVEIMPHERTSPQTTKTLEQFSKAIGHLPVTCRREQPGHLVNTMLMALNTAALTLAANGVADYRDIDRAWMKATHEKRGPFGLLDLVGLDTALEITQYGSRATGSSQIKRNAEYLRSFVEQRRLGIKSGRGFYRYPNPEFEQPEFLAVRPDGESPAAEPSVRAGRGERPSAGC